jgi:lipoic acid synthetase
LNHAVTIETLIPDFKARTESLAILIESRPSVVGHNLETVPKLYRQLKPLSRYEDSLLVLRTIKQINPAMLTKSSLMLGLGETSDDIVGALEDLKEVGCDMVTFGQYLSPSKAHYPVQKFLSLQEFQDYAQLAKEHGFKTVSSGPLVRSSFKAKELFKEAACTM